MTAIGDDFARWIGRTDAVNDDVSVATAQSAAAVFDRDPGALNAGSELPPLWHWFYFLPKAAQAQLGEDGHPQRVPTSFLPPVPLPRRMFAGARLKWHRPLLAGRPSRREAEILRVSMKSGRSGELAFVTVGYRYYQGEGDSAMAQGDLRDADLCIEEEQDIVYREPGPPMPPPIVKAPAALPDGTWSRIVIPDTRMLFRFSALTFNAHRIHYDRPYATGEEGYPGLVVHGPLIAMLLMNLVRDERSGFATAFRFRSQAPLFDLAPFRLVAEPNGRDVTLRAEGPDANVAMHAEASFA